MTWNQTNRLFRAVSTAFWCVVWCIPGSLHKTAKEVFAQNRRNPGVQ